MRSHILCSEMSVHIWGDALSIDSVSSLMHMAPGPGLWLSGLVGDFL